MGIAKDVFIEGSFSKSSTLKGRYTYESIVAAESSSTYKWYQSTDINGTGEIQIVGAVQQTYKVKDIDGGKYIRFEVTPNNASHVGVPVSSSRHMIFSLAGSGTVNNPYQITDINDLRILSETSSIWDKYFIQTADIDVIDTKNWDGGAGFSPIGNETIKFTGEYNGDDYMITHLFITRPTKNNIGLFGKINNATIQNVHIYGANIVGYDYVGVLLGLSESSTSTEIKNVSVTNSNITGKNNYIGAVSGYLEGTSVRNSYSSGNLILEGNLYIGGFTGYMTNRSSIVNGYATSKVNGSSNVGGLVGYMDLRSSVTNAYSTGFVYGVGINIGGLIGQKDAMSSVNFSYYDNETSDQTDVNKGEGLTTSEFKITGTFNSGWNINGSKNSTQPWVMGQGSRPYLYTQSVSINNGLVINDTVDSYVAINVGGSISERGIRYSNILDISNWTEVPSNNVNLGVDRQALGDVISQTGAYFIQPYAKNIKTLFMGTMVDYTRTDDQPIAINVHVNYTQNLDEALEGKYTYQSNITSENGSTYKWYRSEDDLGTGKTELTGQVDGNYVINRMLDIGKYISFEVTPKNDNMIGMSETSDGYFISLHKGQGTQNDPYQISNLNDLRLLSETNEIWDAYFIQTADIDATETKNWNNGTGFLPIGSITKNFTGHYNGDHYSINKLFIDMKERRGLVYLDKLRMRQYRIYI